MPNLVFNLRFNDVLNRYCQTPCLLYCVFDVSCVVIACPPVIKFYVNYPTISEVEFSSGSSTQSKWVFVVKINYRGYNDILQQLSPHSTVHSMKNLSSNHIEISLSDRILQTSRLMIQKRRY